MRGGNVWGGNIWVVGLGGSGLGIVLRVGVGIARVIQGGSREAGGMDTSWCTQGRQVVWTPAGVGRGSWCRQAQAQAQAQGAL